MVMDLFDVVLLHVPTVTWLPLKGLPSNYQQRGGTNTLIRTVDGRCFVFGGMNSDEGCKPVTSPTYRCTGQRPRARRKVSW